MVDSTTAQVRAAQEVIGSSETQADRDYTKKDEVAERVLDGVLDRLNERYGSRLPVPYDRSTKVLEPRTEDFQRVINLAVEDAAARMAQQLDQGESVSQTPARASGDPRSLVTGRVLRIKATAVFVTGIHRSQIKLGDRLVVRRLLVERDPATSRDIRYTEKIGELEVAEIQDEVIVGTFSGAEIVRVGDIVTNR
jgi:hypothetical protein